jgi:cell division protein ZapA (FtsZ GTPase activity inhibitor)
MATDDEQIKGVLVQIFGDEYQIASDGDDVADIRRVASYVDQKMQELAGKQGGSVSKSRLAVWTAMEIAAELFSTAQERNMLTAKAHENLDRLTKLVEERADLSSGLEKRGKVPNEQLLRSQTVRQRDPSRVG